MTRSITVLVGALTLTLTSESTLCAQRKMFFPPLDTAFVNATISRRFGSSGFVRIVAVDSATLRPLTGSVITVHNDYCYHPRGDFVRGVWFPICPYRIVVSANGYTGAILDSVQFMKDTVSNMVVMLSPGVGSRFYRSGMGPYAITCESIYGPPVGKVRVRTIDIETGRAIRGASVRYEPTGEQQLTDTDGVTVLKAPVLGRDLTVKVAHPSYGTVVVPFNKFYDHSAKFVTVHLLRQRFVSRYPRLGSRRPMRFLIQRESTLHKSLTEPEYVLDAFVVSPEVGEPFGPPASWSSDTCFPFRLVRRFPNNTAWVAFARGLVSVRDGTNSTIVDTTSTGGYSGRIGADLEITIQLLPDEP